MSWFSFAYEVINYLWSVEKFGLRSETDPYNKYAALPYLYTYAASEL